MTGQGSMWDAINGINSTSLNALDTFLIAAYVTRCDRLVAAVTMVRPLQQDEPWTKGSLHQGLHAGQGFFRYHERTTGGRPRAFESGSLKIGQEP